MPRNIPLLLIRIIVGIVFITEGVLKFVYPSELGVGRFAHIGLPWPHVLAPVVGALEIAAGGAVMLNLYAGDAAIVLLCIIATALVSTKVSILLGHAVGPFQEPKVEHHGILGFLHEARTDLAMLFSLVAILIDSGVRTGSRRPPGSRK
ncbi:MAG TPA: DoxX family protein [Terracidiphilus sp.]|nr:DoxX family protein [Terracidiphilus sp.]